MTKEIVLVTLATDSQDWGRYSRRPLHHSGVYEKEPEVIAQFLPGEGQARFEAQWTDDGWTFGERVSDA